MIQLIVLGVLALGSMFGIYTWKQSIFKEGAQKQLIADNKVLDVCVQDKATAITANKDLKASIDVVLVDVREATKGLDNLKKQSDLAIQERNKRLALADSLIQTLKQDREIALLAAQNKPTGTCTERLDTITRELLGLSEREFKDRPPVNKESNKDVNKESNKDVNKEPSKEPSKIVPKDTLRVK